MEEFRSKLGVPPEAYPRADNFMRFVITPALLEVNGLSDLGVAIEMVRRHPRAPAHAVEIAWWKKRGEEFRSAQQERNRSKIGRMARLRGQVETVQSPIQMEAMPTAGDTATLPPLALESHSEPQSSAQDETAFDGDLLASLP
jgi:hypothetical protein